MELNYVSTDIRYWAAMLGSAIGGLLVSVWHIGLASASIGMMAVLALVLGPRIRAIFAAQAL